MSAQTIRDYGDRALLIECGSTHEVLAVADALRDADLPGVTDIVPGARTVLVALTEPAHQGPTRTRLADIDVSTAAASARPDDADVVIDVVYDGADLGAVAALRETSIVFSAILARMVLGERLSAARVVGCVTVALGAVVIGAGDG